MLSIRVVFIVVMVVRVVIARVFVVVVLNAAIKYE